jgi:uncharacterized Zn-binding protein involved in type VI secretion
VIGIVLSTQSPAVIRASGTWFVAPTGNDTNDCLSAATACKTISAAIGKAADGDTLIIAAGIYTERPGRVSKSLTLMGAGAEDTILDGGGDNNSILWIDAMMSISGITIRNGAPALLVNDLARLALDRVQITGNLRQGTGAGIWNFGTLVANDIVIQDNTATYNAAGIFNEGQATLTRARITGNTAGYDGGGIWNRSTGTMTLTSVLIEDNHTTSTDPTVRTSGGGILNEGTLRVDGGTFRDNSAAEGGAIQNYHNGKLILRHVLLANNTADVGGGVDNHLIPISSGLLSATNVTISGNQASRAGGGMASSGAGSTLLTNVTITSNTAPSGAGVSGFGLRVHNTIIANNVGANCSWKVAASLGHNLESGTSCGLTDPSDQSSSDPRLGPLTDNGGPSLTHALLSGSPAIDAGDDTGCPQTDQRGIMRPQDGDIDTSARCDIGAFEVEPKMLLYLPLLKR